MRKVMKLNVVLIVVVSLMLGHIHTAKADESDSVKTLHGRYKQSADQAKQKEALLELSRKEPRTEDDVYELRAIFSRKDYDEHLFEAAIESLKKVKDPSQDTALIEILKDEKPFVDKAGKKDFQEKSEGELSRRGTNIMFIIMKLGELKSQNAVPVLKEYLNSPNFQHTASEALAKIGDKSASEEMRERAYRGEEINYGGQGMGEARKIISDLEDQSKREQWPEIAKQLTRIRDPKAKPYLKKLFKHDADFVRGQSAMAFSNMVTEADANEIMEMSKSEDWFVRSRSLDAMKRIRNISFENVLIYLLRHDPKDIIRHHTAKTIGYKKVEKAIPHLENALKDKSVRVREEAFISLYVLTGKKYDFDGKTLRIEQRAEREKDSPSFW